jgi:hypothetical protein
VQHSALSRLTVVLLLSVSGVVACSGGDGVGPDPLRPQYYQLQWFDGSSMPAVLKVGLFNRDTTFLDSATLSPFAVGRTIDQRFFGDRTGRGTTGGNTRDTTVARGQFMERRTIKHVTHSLGTVTFERDSLLVDVEVRDTVVIITRPHPNPVLVQVDTGYFLNNLLVLPTVLRNLMGQSYGPRPVVFTYRIER